MARRTRKRISQPRAQRETSAGGVVFRRGPDGQVRFLLIRDSYKNWGFPKGHLESGEHTSELQSRLHLVCRLLLEKKKQTTDRWQKRPALNTEVGPVHTDRRTTAHLLVAW